MNGKSFFFSFYSFIAGSKKCSLQRNEPVQINKKETNKRISSEQFI